MSKLRIVFILISFCCSSLLGHSQFANPQVSKIAFGSCAKEYKEQPILNKVIAEQPELFIYLGDNLYGDTEDMDLLRQKYSQLAEKEEFKALQAQAKVLAIWDDHDYGQNDAGRHYPKKAESKEIFLNFWNEPKDSERWNREGIYHVEYFGEGDKRLQVILLDTRTFRDDLALSEAKPDLHKYRPHTSLDSTILGAPQWEWLEKQLKEPATFRIIATSIQYAHQYNGWESWNNYPAEQQKLLDVIARTKAEGVFLMSGDVHYSELSMRKMEGLYPIYDITSSGLTHTIPLVWKNQYRIGRGYHHKSFGCITIDWEATDPTLTFELKSIRGKTVLKHTVLRSELSF